MTCIETEWDNPALVPVRVIVKLAGRAKVADAVTLRPNVLVVTVVESVFVDVVVGVVAVHIDVPIDIVTPIGMPVGTRNIVPAKPHIPVKVMVEFLELGGGGGGAMLRADGLASIAKSPEQDTTAGAGTAGICTTSSEIPVCSSLPWTCICQLATAPNAPAATVRSTSLAWKTNVCD